MKSKAKFILSKKMIKEQLDKLLDLGLKVSYSLKTNKQVGKVIQDMNLDCDFSIHVFSEIELIENKEKIWFFLQAEDKEQIKEILEKGVKNFVIDNEIDLQNLLEVVKETDKKINLSLRMKFRENRIGTGKYFVYGLESRKVNELIFQLKDNKNIEKLGIHIHRKSQNTSEWLIIEELKDSLTKETLEIIKFINFGGGLPIKYKTYTSKVMPYIFQQLKKGVEWLKEKNIGTYIEPGRFIAGPCIKLETEIIQVQGKNIIINTSIYQAALDTHITGIKLEIENELDEKGIGDYYLIKGNSPTRDDIFRYKVKLSREQVKVGEKIVFLNAGAYNYATDFFGYNPLKTEVTN